MMTLITYLLSATLMFACAFVVFRILVRSDYRKKGHLTPLSGFLELLICAFYFAFPYLFNPPCWAEFWACGTDVSPMLQALGWFSIAAGAMIAFPSMLWLGLGKTMGQISKGLNRRGFYRFTRNPQVVGGALMVIGIALLWPSLYSGGWVLLYASIFHMMVLTEEEHLRAIFGEEYERYCKKVSRYIGIPR